VSHHLQGVHWYHREIALPMNQPDLRPPPPSFADHSHIVFIRTSGQVYSMEAVEQMNVKIKCWTVRDALFSHDPQLRVCVFFLPLSKWLQRIGSHHGRPLHSQRYHKVRLSGPLFFFPDTTLCVCNNSIQDPSNMQKRNISDFHYVKEGLTVKDEEEEDVSKYINATGTTQKVLQELATV